MMSREAGEPGGSRSPGALDRTMAALEELVATVADLIDADAAALLLQDEREGRLAVAVRVGPPAPDASADVPADVVPLTDPLAARLLEESAPALADLTQ